MSDPDRASLLTDIRELQRQQVQLTEQSPKNQAQSLANQERSLQRQLSNQQILIKGRRLSGILRGLRVARVFLYLLQPLVLFWLAWQRSK